MIIIRNLHNEFQLELGERVNKQEVLRREQSKFTTQYAITNARKATIT